MAKRNHNNKQLTQTRDNLLAWYDKNRRVLPWRALPGVKADPYHVWLSEIMLQQTTVGAVIPYFLKFLKAWPTVKDLAKAPTEDVMRAWAGLGYYARARNLLACAKIIAEQDGKFPDNEKDLKALPGIGDYTAAAILTIAFNKPAVVVDGNIERVTARYFAIEEPLPANKPLIKEMAASFFKNEKRPGDIAQALMDLGAGVCIPGTPRCALCPLNNTCAAYKKGIAATLPRKAEKKISPKKYGYVYWITDKKGRVLIHRRPEKGLLGGMDGLPTSDWGKSKTNIPHLSFIKDHKNDGKMKIRHVFTHFDLELRLKTISASFKAPDGFFWAEAKSIPSLGFPTVFKKAVNIFIKEK
jgi:A/G-specific adenine glycosylase